MEQRIDEGSPWQLEQPLEHQGSLDGSVTIVETGPSATMVANCLPVHPEGQRTALRQGLVVLFPVADLVLGLAHLMHSEVVLQDQVAEVADSFLI